jgi:hypothetical protein
VKDNFLTKREDENLKKSHINISRKERSARGSEAQQGVAGQTVSKPFTASMKITDI